MGIDYDANFGLGYQVEPSDEISEEDLEEGLAEYLWGELGSDFDHFEVGRGSYSGEEDDCFVVTKEEINERSDLQAIKAALDKELERLRVEPVSTFTIVGGLRVW